MSAADLGCGLIACRDSGEGWPPTLPEFRAMCRPNHGLTAMERAAHREFEPDRLLEDHGAKEAAKAAGEKALSEINAMWGDS